MQVCEDMEGCRCVRTWEDADIGGHWMIQMCEDVGGYRCVRTWKMQMCEDMG